MTDITSSDTINSVIELSNNVVDSNPTEGFLNLIKTKFSENKMYVYIGIAVIVLGIVLYYFYIKNKKETNGKPDTKPVLELPKQQEQPEPKAQEYYKTMPQISADEYLVMDAQGRPVKVSGAYPQVGLPNQVQPLPIPKQAPSATEIKMLQQQMLQQQMLQQQMLQQQQFEQQQFEQQQFKQQQFEQQQFKQKQFEQQQIEQHKRQLAEQKAVQAKKSRPKLTHPEDSENPENAEDSDNTDFNDIDLELARIKANEDNNVGQHDLTNSELAEITKKLEIMGTQLKD